MRRQSAPYVETSHWRRPHRQPCRRRPRRSRAPSAGEHGGAPAAECALPALRSQPWAPSNSPLPCGSAALLAPSRMLQLCGAEHARSHASGGARCFDGRVPSGGPGSPPRRQRRSMDDGVGRRGRGREKEGRGGLGAGPFRQGHPWRGGRAGGPQARGLFCVRVVGACGARATAPLPPQMSRPPRSRLPLPLALVPAPRPRGAVVGAPLAACAPALVEAPAEGAAGDAGWSTGPAVLAFTGHAAAARVRALPAARR
jgi:hypothetical protein